MHKYLDWASAIFTLLLIMACSFVLALAALAVSLIIGGDFFWAIAAGAAGIILLSIFGN